MSKGSCHCWKKTFKDAVRDSVWRKVVDIWVQQPVKLHPCLPCVWSTVLIGWDCLRLSPSHYVCFPFTEPGLCINTQVFLNASTEQTGVGGLWGAICWILQKMCGIRIANCTFKAQFTKHAIMFWKKCRCLMFLDVSDVCVALLSVHASRG